MGSSRWTSRTAAILFGVERSMVVEEGDLATVLSVEEHGLFQSLILSECDIKPERSAEPRMFYTMSLFRFTSCSEIGQKHPIIISEPLRRRGSPFDRILFWRSGVGIEPQIR